MRILKNKAFHQWSKDTDLTDEGLKQTVEDLIQGKFEACLGGNIYKKRIGLNNRGKRGGVRTIIAFKVNDKAIFIYGYAKNVRDNITTKEEMALKALARVYFSYSDHQISLAIKAGELIEVTL